MILLESALGLVAWFVVANIVEVFAFQAWLSSQNLQNIIQIISYSHTLDRSILTHVCAGVSENLVGYIQSF